MNLKKAFHYQKVIGVIQHEILYREMDVENFVVVEENHKRSELNFYFNDSNNKYEDEIKRLKSKNVKNYEFSKLVAIYRYLCDCRIKLAQAISNIKDSMRIGEEGLTYDAAVLKANDMRDFAAYCRVIARTVEEEKDTSASLNFMQGTERVCASYTITKTTAPIEGVVDAARDEYERIQSMVNDLSDAIEAAALTCQLPKEAEPTFPVTADLDYIYKHYEEYK